MPSLNIVAVASVASALALFSLACFLFELRQQPGNQSPETKESRNGLILLHLQLQSRHMHHQHCQPASQQPCLEVYRVKIPPGTATHTDESVERIITTLNHFALDLERRRHSIGTPNLFFQIFPRPADEPFIFPAHGAARSTLAAELKRSESQLASVRVGRLVDSALTC